MGEREGVIKYTLDFVRAKLDSQNLPAYLTDELISQAMHRLNEARKLCLDSEIIGQNPARYHGLGFGNISIRLQGETFLVSGSQTGHLSLLNASDCAWVRSIQPESNRLVAQGETKPSSESLTHGVIYQVLPWVNGVVHGHCSEIWSNSDTLGLPAIKSDVPYGTPEMALAVFDLCHHNFKMPTAGSNAFVFVMKGHEDGVVALAETAMDAAILLAQLKKTITG
jgi:ribulose-5-phosphate 4-epimerase/fuculose-1-phosphate aldolase